MPANTIPGPLTSQVYRYSSATDSLDPSTRDQTWQPQNDVMHDSKTRRILIVDDDPEVLQLIIHMVVCLGLIPDSAEDARGALSQMKQTHYDLVLTDYIMPFLDGYQLATQIKQGHEKTKVIIMTGHCENGIRQMLNASNVVDGLLLKPFNLATLKEKINAVVDRSGSGGFAR